MTDRRSPSVSVPHEIPLIPAPPESNAQNPSLSRFHSCPMTRAHPDPARRGRGRAQPHLVWAAPVVAPRAEWAARESVARLWAADPAAAWEVVAASAIAPRHLRQSRRRKLAI